MDPSLLGTVLEKYGALGVLAVSVFWLVKMTLPKILDRHYRLEEAREDNFLKAMKALHKQNRTNTYIVAKVFALMLLHDATVRGQNSQVMGGVEDIISRLFPDLDIDDWKEEFKNESKSKAG